MGGIRRPCNRGVAAFSLIDPYNFPCIQEGHISLVFHFKYFLFLFCKKIARSCVSRIILSAVCTSNFFQVIFFHVVRILFPAFGQRMSSSTCFPVVCLYFWHLKHLRGAGTYCSTLTRQLLIFTSLGVRDVSVGLDSFFAFSDGDSSNILNSLFSHS